VLQGIPFLSHPQTIEIQDGVPANDIYDAPLTRAAMHDGDPPLLAIPSPYPNNRAIFGSHTIRVDRRAALPPHVSEPSAKHIRRPAGERCGGVLTAGRPFQALWPPSPAIGRSVGTAFERGIPVMSRFSGSGEGAAGIECMQASGTRRHPRIRRRGASRTEDLPDGLRGAP